MSGMEQYLYLIDIQQYFCVLSPVVNLNIKIDDQVRELMLQFETPV